MPVTQNGFRPDHLKNARTFRRVGPPLADQVALASWSFSRSFRLAAYSRGLITNIHSSRRRLAARLGSDISPHLAKVAHAYR